MFDPRLLSALRDARRVVALTGAGISAESGVPTFRDALTGLWAKFNPEELGTVAAFKRNPRLVWGWYAARRRQAREVAPNPGHLALAEIERRAPEFTLITQNIDGLHQRAGSRRVIELHGNIQRVKCLEEDAVLPDWRDETEPPPLDAAVKVPPGDDTGVPRCPRCNAYLRPDVVWFGEMLPPREFDAAHGASQAADVFFSIGTSAVVQPAAALPMVALSNGATLIEVNPDQTNLTPHATFSLRGPSGQILPELVRAAWLE